MVKIVGSGAGKAPEAKTENSAIFEMIAGKEMYAWISVDEKNAERKIRAGKNSLFISPGKPFASRGFDEVRGEKAAGERSHPCCFRRRAKMMLFLH